MKNTKKTNRGKARTEKKSGLKTKPRTTEKKAVVTTVGFIPIKQLEMLKTWVNQLSDTVMFQAKKTLEEQNIAELNRCAIGLETAQTDIERLLIQFPKSKDSLTLIKQRVSDLRSVMGGILEERSKAKDPLPQEPADKPPVVLHQTVVNQPPTSPVAETVKESGSLTQENLGEIREEIRNTLLLIQKRNEEQQQRKLPIKPKRVSKPKTKVTPTPPVIPQDAVKEQVLKGLLKKFSDEYLQLLGELHKNPPGIAERFDTLGVKVFNETGNYPENQELKLLHASIVAIVNRLTEAKTKEEPEVKAPQVAPPQQVWWKNFLRDHWGKVALSLVGLLLLIALGVGSYKFGPGLVSWLKSSPQAGVIGDYKKIPVPQGLGDTTNNSSALNAVGEAMAPTPITITPAPASAGPSIIVSGTSGNSNVITSTIYNFIDNSNGVKENSVAQPSKSWPEVCTLETVDLDPRLHHKKQFSLAPGNSQKFRIPKGWNVKTFSMTHQELYSLWEGGMMNRPDISEEIDSSCVSLFNNKLQVELRFWFEFESRDLSR